MKRVGIWLLLGGRQMESSGFYWKPLYNGLLTVSFILDRAQRELCELVTYRKSLVQDKPHELNRPLYLCGCYSLI